MSRHPSDHRWRMGGVGRTTISVLDEHEDAKAARKRQQEEGAEVVPFGFARALPKPPVVEPEAWEGNPS